MLKNGVALILILFAVLFVGKLFVGLMEKPVLLDADPDPFKLGKRLPMASDLSILAFSRSSSYCSTVKLFSTAYSTHSCKVHLRACALEKVTANNSSNIVMLFFIRFLILVVKMMVSMD